MNHLHHLLAGALALTPLAACGSSTPQPEAPPAEDLPDGAEEGAPDADPAGDGGQATGPAGATATAAAASEPAHPLVAACDKGDAEACDNAALAYFEGNGVKQDKVRALGLFDKACDGKRARGCFNAAIMRHQGDGVPADKTAALGWFKAACALDHPRGCRNAGVMLYQGEGVPRDYGKARPLFDRGCALKDATSCFNAGVIQLKGHGVPKSQDKALAHFAQACKLGHAKACELQKELEKPATPAVSGANISMGQVSADGLTARDLSCNVKGLGLFGAVGIIGSLSKTKGALDRCAPKGAAPLVRWSFAGGRVSSAKAERASAAVNACVARVIRTTRPPGSGECVATLLIGNKAGAEAAAAKK